MPPLSVPTIEIGGRRIGPGCPTYVVAEISANHRQSFDTAEALVRAAAEVGADAVKLQTYTPETLTIRCDAEPFRIAGGTPWDGRTLFELYSETYTPWEWHPRLMSLAAELGIGCFSTPFDPTAVDFLEALGTPAYKVASFELVDLALIERVAATGKPLLLSTGMAGLAEIEEAVRAARSAGAAQLALLRCTSAYPAPPEEARLRTIPHLAEAFSVPVGLSDHTLGIAVAVAAVALGAAIVEKHLTLSRDAPGADAAFSLLPAEFRAMVEAVRTAEKALGEVRYGAAESERASLVFRRSLVVVEDVAHGEPLTERNVRAIRPGGGLAPKLLPAVLGRRAKRPIARGTPLSWSLLE